MYFLEGLCAYAISSNSVLACLFMFMNGIAGLLLFSDIDVIIFTLRTNDKVL